jgi:general secretion pathway protein M
MTTTISHPAELNFKRHASAATIYVLLIGVLIGGTWYAFSTISERRATVAAAETMLAQLEGRLPQAAKDRGSLLGVAPTGSPFLEGQTVTVAGAALLQRIGGAVSRVGGTVLSSQVELQRADSQDGWIGLVVSCDINLESLQKLLYDVETGMPFVFIDQLVVQPPVSGVEASRMRVLLAVSAQWGGRK